ETIKQVESPQREVVGVEALRALAERAAHLGFADVRRDGGDRLLGDLLLQLEEIVDPAVDLVGPQDGLSLGIRELGSDTEPVADAAGAPGEDVAYAELAAH